MKFFLGLFIILFLSFGNSFAREWSLYAGVAGHFSAVYPFFDFQSLTRTGGEYPFGSFGSQTEIGVQSKKWEAYIGYFFMASPFNGDYNRYYEGSLSSYNDKTWSNSWREKQLFIGVRCNFMDKYSARVLPIVGVGLSIGESTLQDNYEDHFHYYDYNLEQWQTIIVEKYHESRKSGNTIGEFLEFGLLIQPVSHIETIVLAKLQRREVNFGDDNIDRTADRYIVLTSTLQIGVRYLIPMGK